MDLQLRIERLERSNRRLKRVAAAVLLAAGAAVAMGQASPEKPKTLSAASFVVVDDEGRQRAVLGMEDGAPVFVFSNSAGREVVRLEVPTVGERAAMYLIDPVERSRLELAMTMNGPVIHLTDAAGPRVRLATNELNAPLAAVYDAEGKTLFEVSGKK